MRLHITKRHDAALANDLREKQIAASFGLQIIMNFIESVQQDIEESICELFHTTFLS
jgi:hypothetical protein